MRSPLKYLALLTIALAAPGCRFTTPDGGAMNLAEYDSITVEQVQLAPGIKEMDVGQLLKGFTSLKVLTSDDWRLAEAFNLDAFAQEVEQFSITMDGDDSKPDKPEITREDFLKKHADAREAQQTELAIPAGTKPVKLRMLVTELRFPENFEAVTLGTKPRMRCKVDVYADGKLLGSGEMESVAGLPGIPLVPSAMAGRVAEAVFFDSYTKKTILKLVEEMADETVGALERAK